jgi:hypothetical protein
MLDARYRMLDYWMKETGAKFKTYALLTIMTNDSPRPINIGANGMNNDLYKYAENRS